MVKAAKPTPLNYYADLCKSVSNQNSLMYESPRQTTQKQGPNKLCPQKSSEPCWMLLNLERSPSKINKPATQPGQIDEQWVKDLQMFKK